MSFRFRGVVDVDAYLHRGSHQEVMNYRDLTTGVLTESVLQRIGANCLITAEHVIEEKRKKRRKLVWRSLNSLLAQCGKLIFVDTERQSETITR